MGWASAGTQFIFGVAVISTLYFVVQDVGEVTETIADSGDRLREVEEAERESEIAFLDVDFSAGVVQILARNVGTATLAPSGVSVLLDGRVVDATRTIEVQGAATSKHWLPNTNVTINVTGEAAAPAIVRLVASSGDVATWIRASPVLASLQLVPHSATIPAGNTQAFALLAYDRLGNRVTINADQIRATTTAGTVTVTGENALSVTAGATGSDKVLSVRVGSFRVNAAIEVAAPPIDRFEFAAIATQTAGTGFSITVTAKKSDGSVCTAYNGLTAALTVNGGTISPTTTPSFTNGVATFSVTLTASGSRTITVTDSGAGSSSTGATGTSAAFAVNPGAFAAFALTGVPGTATAGTAFGSITVTAQDAYGNTRTDYTGTVNWTGTAAWGNYPANYAFVLGDGGVKTFGAGTFTIKTAGAQTLTVKDTVQTSITATSGAVTVNPGSLNYVRLRTAASGAGTDITSTTRTLTSGQTLTIYAAGYDAYANFKADQTATWTGSGGHTNCFTMNPVSEGSGASETLTWFAACVPTKDVTATVAGVTDTLVTIDTN